MSTIHGVELSTAADGPAGSAVRRRPTQVRSRQRFEQVLDAAGALIVERGLGPITMTDIAERAGMAVTAVYRYFPSKQSVVRELALRTFDTDAELTVHFAQDSALPAQDRVVGAVETYCRRHLRDRLRLQVRAAVHADSELSALDLEDSRRNAAVIAAALGQQGIDVSRDDLERRALIFVELVDALIRLAGRVGPDEAEALIQEFAMSIRAMLLRGDAPDRAR